MTTTQARTALVVLLTDLTVHGDVIPVDTVLEVERAIRNDWFGSKLCRDATPEEIAEYRAQEGGADAFDAQLQADQAQLIADVDRLQERKTELAGDLKALESDIEQFGQQRTTLQAEVDDLGKQKKALADEVAALEKAKAAAAKK